MLTQTFLLHLAPICGMMIEIMSLRASAHTGVAIPKGEVLCSIMYTS